MHLSNWWFDFHMHPKHVDKTSQTQAHTFGNHSQDCRNKALEIEPANQTAIYHKNKVLWQIEKKNKVSFLDKIRK